MQIILVKTAGFCFGVDRAVSLVEEAVREGKRVATLGPIIHNRHVIERFTALGVREIAAPEEARPGECVVIRSHGVTRTIMEQLAGYTLVGFHVKGYPVTDELLAPFAGHKSMVNFGVENGTLTDACFPVFSAMPKLRILLLTGNAGIDGSGLSALQGCKLDLLTLDHTGLDDAGLLQAASIPKLSHIWIDHTAVTYDGLLAVAGNNYIKPVAHVQFTKEQMEHFSQLQREKAKKPVQLDEQAASECRSVLSAFFAEMTEWEQYMEQVGFEDAEAVPRLLAIWEKYVSEKPRLGYRPLALSYSAQGTYNGEEFLDAEQITKNKLYIYTREKNTSFDRRFLMKRVGEGWMIDAVQERLNGWQRTGL